VYQLKDFLKFFCDDELRQFSEKQKQKLKLKIKVLLV
jgi:hypothetical protein